jgi:RNA 3'-terminal phosphate cyclase-like protein
VGLAASAALLEQIRDGGTVDATHQPLMLLLMALCPEDVSRVRTGPLTSHTERLLRLIRDYLGVTFQIKQDLEDSSVLLSCRGSNLRNIALRTS